MKELINILNKQHAKLNQLLETVIEQQAFIINNDAAGMEEILLKEEKIFKELYIGEEAKNELILQEAAKLNLPADEITLNKLIAALAERKNSLAADLKEKIDLLKMTAKNIFLINRQNSLLIETSRSLVKETVAALIKQKKILDRKV